MEWAFSVLVERWRTRVPKTDAVSVKERCHYVRIIARKQVAAAYPITAVVNMGERSRIAEMICGYIYTAQCMLYGWPS